MKNNRNIQIIVFCKPCNYKDDLETISGEESTISEKESTPGRLTARSNTATQRHLVLQCADKF